MTASRGLAAEMVLRSLGHLVDEPTSTPVRPTPWWRRLRKRQLRRGADQLRADTLHELAVEFLSVSLTLIRTHYAAQFRGDDQRLVAAVFDALERAEMYAGLEAAAKS